MTILIGNVMLTKNQISIYRPAAVVTILYDIQDKNANAWYQGF